MPTHFSSHHWDSFQAFQAKKKKTIVASKKKAQRWKTKKNRKLLWLSFFNYCSGVKKIYVLFSSPLYTCTTIIYALNFAHTIIFFKSFFFFLKKVFPNQKKSLCTLLILKFLFFTLRTTASNWRKCLHSRISSTALITQSTWVLSEIIISSNCKNKIHK